MIYIATVIAALSDHIPRKEQTDLMLKSVSSEVLMSKAAATLEGLRTTSESCRL